MCVCVCVFVRACRRARPSSTLTLYTFTLEVWIDRLSRNVGNYQYTLSNITEGRTSRLHRGRNLKSRILRGFLKVGKYYADQVLL